MADSLISKAGYRLDQMWRETPWMESHYKQLRNRMMTKEFLSSKEFEELFLRHVEDKANFDAKLDDAESHSQNFKFRHIKMNRALGCWRWKGLFSNRKFLVPLIYDPAKKGIDFGGAAGPVAPNVTVVDFSKTDLFNRPVKFSSLTDVPFQADFIFSSHTLEHIDDLDTIFSQFQKVLKPGGDLILNLPAYSCVRWRNGLHTNKKYNDHKWTFHLAETTMNKDINKPLAIDSLLEKYFEIVEKSYCGDNSIFIKAKRSAD